MLLTTFTSLFHSLKTKKLLYTTYVTLHFFLINFQNELFRNNFKEVHKRFSSDYRVVLTRSPSTIRTNFLIKNTRADLSLDYCVNSTSFFLFFIKPFLL